MFASFADTLAEGTVLLFIVGVVAILSVKKYLTVKGVDAKRLSTKGWGDTKPVADNRTEDGRAQNRRVELVKK